MAAVPENIDFFCNRREPRESSWSERNEKKRPKVGRPSPQTFTTDLDR